MNRRLAIAEPAAMAKYEDVDKMIKEAISRGDIGEVRWLINSHGLHRTANGGHSLLREAISRHQSDIAKFLIEAGARVNNPVDPEPQGSLLHLAVEHQQMDVAEMMIRRGADINVVDRFKETPLEYSKRNERGGREFRDVLYDCGFNPSDSDESE